MKTKMIFPIESLLLTDIVVNFMQEHIYFLSIFNFLLLLLMYLSLGVGFDVSDLLKLFTKEKMFNFVYIKEQKSEQ